MSFVVTAVTAEVVTIASVATAVAELGMVLQVVGAVTGSKDLMKVGGFMALAGGVTSLAAGALDAAEAGGLSSLSAADSAAGDSALSAGQTTADLGSDYAGTAGTAASAGAPSATSVTNDATNTMLDTAPAPAAATATDTTAGVDAAGSASTNATTADSAAGTDSASSSAANSANQYAPQAPTGPDTASAPTNPTNATATDGTSISSDATPVSNIGTTVQPPIGSDDASIGKWWASQSPSTKNVIAQSGFKAVGGLFQGWSDDQKLALERNKFALQQQQYNTSMANASAIPTTNFQSKPTGFISSVRSN